MRIIAKSQHRPKMSNMSFLSYQRHNITRNHSFTKKPQRSLIKTISSFSSSSSSSTPASRAFRPSLEEMRRVFNKYDADGDGRISLPEYRAALRATAGGGAAARRMFEVADRDGDGFVDFEEFVGASTGGGGVRMADIRAAFRVFDIDGDGRISAAELAEVLKRIGEECEVEACRRMVRAVDRDGDGLIDMDEFVTMMTRTMKLVTN